MTFPNKVINNTPRYNVCKFIVMNSYEQYVLITFYLGWGIVLSIVLLNIIGDLFPNTKFGKKIRRFFGD
jgi:hypothetical protein